MIIDGLNDEEIIKAIHSGYLKHLIFIFKPLIYSSNDNNASSRFSWTGNKHIHIYIVMVYAKKVEYASLFFATKEKEKDQLTYLDLIKETKNYQFENLFDPKSKLDYIADKSLTIHKLKGDILEGSINIPSNTINFYSAERISHNTKISYYNNIGEEFAENEYKRSHENLIKSNKVEPFPIANQRIFVDTYHFDKMLKFIHDEQFTDEFNQCLFAYEHEKWFLCAAGIGSCLEHLMLLTLSNYHKEKGLGRNPTAKDYLKAFTKEPIKLESRQQTYIDCLFRLRNSVDHHNAGYTSKEICDVLLHGLTEVFNEYFVPSVSDKQSN